MGTECLRIKLFFVGFCLVTLSACQPAMEKTPENVAIETTATDSMTKPTSTEEVMEATSTPFVTLEASYQSEQQYLDWLFSINQTSGCRLPCWWGFEPQTAALDSMKTVLAPLGFSEFPVDEKGYIGAGPDLRGSQNNFGVVYADFRFKGGILQHLSAVLDRSLMEGAGLELVKKEYYPPQILTTYGSPADIYIRGQFPFEPSTTWIYELWLIYPKNGFIIVYRGEATLPTNWGEEPTGTNLEVCVNDASLTGIDLYLQQPDADDFLNVIRFYNVPLRIRENPLYELDGIVKTWEESTLLTLADFIGIFGESGEGCFRTPAEIWQ